MPNKNPTSLKSPRTAVKRLPKRGHYEFDTIAAILDEALICHVGFAVKGQPYVIPTAFGRKDRTLYVHGSAVSRTLGVLAAEPPICITVTLIDGLVLARSGFHSSINYRSVVMLGRPKLVEGEEKLTALECISEHLVPGRWRDIRGPTRKELNATKVLQLPINEASAKIRTGPPIDDEEDYALPCWAGLLPLELTAGKAIADARLPAQTKLPAYLLRYDRGRSSCDD